MERNYKNEYMLGVCDCKSCPFYRTSYSADKITDKECHADPENVRMTYYGSGDIFKDCPLKNENIILYLKQRVES